MSPTAEELRTPESRGKEKRLWRGFAVNRDPAARDRLIEFYMPLARRMASRYSGVSEPYDDLLQVASLGLLNAVNRFDPSLGTPFAGFAKPTILGELKRHFRDKVWTVRVPRSVHDRMAKVETMSEKLTLEFRRAPSVEELAEAVGIEPATVLEILEARHNRRPVSLDAPPAGADRDETSGEEWVGGLDGNYDLVDDRVTVRSALPGLDDREREVLRLRFIEDLPQTEIAMRIGCSQMHISRLLRQALDKLREETTS